MSRAVVLSLQCGGATPYVSTAFHPDGLLLAIGTSDAKAQIWEMRQQKAVTGFEAGAAGPPWSPC